MNNIETWYYVHEGASVGPLPRAAIESLIQSGAIRPDTLVSPGYGDWVPASSSALAPLFAAAPGVGALKGGALAQRIEGWLPKDKRVRTIVLVVIALAGLYAIYDGIRTMRDGAGEMSGGGDASINFLGCRGISVDTVQCGYQNTGQVKRSLCMDVVVICADGRHVASACSDRMNPGESSTKLVNNFRPGLNAMVQCSNIEYENMKAKG